MIQFKQLIKDIQTDWKIILLEIYKMKSKEFKNLEQKIEEDYNHFDGYFEIFPPPPLIFNAFNFFNFNQLKIVIIGQDPYHGEGQAMGLSFSVPPKIKIPPSLVNIYKEIKSNYPEFEIPKHGDLTKWAQQGILLLNASLTVRQQKANSHQSFWRQTQFTDLIIKYISDNNSNIIFLLWGNFAKDKKKFIDDTKHFIIEGAHPSPLSARYWFGCGHFKMTNEILTQKLNKKPIDWQV